MLLMQNVCKLFYFNLTYINDNYTISLLHESFNTCFKCQWHHSTVSVQPLWCINVDVCDLSHVFETSQFTKTPR